MFTKAFETFCKRAFLKQKKWDWFHLSKLKRHMLLVVEYFDDLVQFGDVMKGITVPSSERHHKLIGTNNWWFKSIVNVPGIITTLPETNVSIRLHRPKSRNFIFQASIFRCESLRKLRFREGITR